MHLIHPTFNPSLHLQIPSEMFLITKMLVINLTIHPIAFLKVRIQRPPFARMRITPPPRRTFLFSLLPRETRAGPGGRAAEFAVSRGDGVGGGVLLVVVVALGGV